MMSNEKLTDNMDIIKTPYSKHKSMILDTALEIYENDAREVKEVGYIARSLIIATLPHSDPKKNYFERINGHYKLSIVGGPDGIPYGSIPRLIFIYLTMRCMETKSREIILGNTLAMFMKDLGLKPTGGKRGTIAALKKQMERLVDSRISIGYNDGKSKRGKHVDIVKDYDLFWQQHKENKTKESSIVLGEELFNEIIKRPVPIDMRVIRVLKGSSLALDIYQWMTWRVYRLEKPILLKWRDLKIQFGSEYADDSRGRYAFKKKFIDQLVKVKTCYSKLDVYEAKDGLIVSPSPTHVPKKVRSTGQ